MAGQSFSPIEVQPAVSLRVVPPCSPDPGPLPGLPEVSQPVQSAHRRCARFAGPDDELNARIRKDASEPNLAAANALAVPDGPSRAPGSASKSARIAVS